MSIPADYIPVLIQAGVAFGFVFLVLILTHLLGPKRTGSRKDSSFECGIESQGNARIPVSIKYFMTAILFVLFDLEIIFFYPYAVNFKDLGTDGFIAVLIFVSVFMLGFLYMLKKGAFEWDN